MDKTRIEDTARWPRQPQQGGSYAIGATELSTAVMLILGAFNAAASALGAAMSSVTFVITLSFVLTTPGVAEPTAGGFPAISYPLDASPPSGLCQP
jgi:uncharacterized membrane protein YkgB